MHGNCWFAISKYGKLFLFKLHFITEVIEWFTVLCCGTHGHRFEPPPMLVDTWFANMWIEKAQLPCWHLYSQQVLHQRWIWGSLQARKARKHLFTRALKPRADVTRSPKRISVAPHKELQNFFLKKLRFLQKKISRCPWTLLTYHMYVPSQLATKGFFQNYQFIVPYKQVYYPVEEQMKSPDFYA